MIATLCDTHGNLAALNPVLAELPDDCTLVVGGDIVAGGDQPRETLERLRELGQRVVWLRGNTDRALMPGESATLANQAAIETGRARLTHEQIGFLYRLPPIVLLNGVLHCHASPRNDIDIFTERTPEQRLRFLFADIEADTVVCGHTHIQFVRTIAGKRVINAGSVGRYRTLRKPRHSRGRAA